MPKFSKECAEKSATGTVFGGGAASDEVVSACENLLTGSLKPDMVGQPIRQRFVDGIIIVSWSKIKAVP